MSMTPQQLKNSILQRAIEGELVKQRPEEGTGEELYQRIQQEKQKFIKPGKLKKEKPLPLISEKEIPFDIPENWKWTRIANVAEIVTGSTPSKLHSEYFEGSFPFYKPGDIVQGSIYACARDHLTQKALKIVRIIPANSVCVCCIGSIGKSAIIKDEGTTNQQINSIINFPETKFLYYFCQSSFFIGQMIAVQSMTTLPIVNKSKMEKLLIPLPPLAEQKRIVAKIEELLPYVDEYEKAWNKLEELNKRFPDDIKKSILQEAIQGKLVEQRPEEGTGEELYQKIQKEKQKLIKSGNLKKEKPLPEITDDEIPFDIPESWKWVRLGQIGTWGSGATPAKGNRDYYNGRIPWLLTGDLNDGIIREMSGRITDKALSDTSVHMNPKGSVLMAMYGATIGKLGILGIAATTNQACCACDPFSGVDNKFLFYYLMARRKYYIDLGAGSGQPNISKAKIVISLFALPPLAEQKHIVAKIEELLPYINQLKEEK